MRKDLGYRIHTNRELGMMTRHEKPLAVFCDVEGFFPPSLLRYLRLFDRRVESGHLAKKEHREPVAVRGERYILLTILYAQPEEAWRIDAMIELRQRLHHEPWTADLEQQEGRLLGYTDAQNDIWIATR